MKKQQRLSLPGSPPSDQKRNKRRNDQSASGNDSPDTSQYKLRKVAKRVNTPPISPAPIFLEKPAQEPKNKKLKARRRTLFPVKEIEDLTSTLEGNIPYLEDIVDDIGPKWLAERETLELSDLQKRIALIEFHKTPAAIKHPYVRLLKINIRQHQNANKLDLKKLQHSLIQVIQRHETLRTGIDTNKLQRKVIQPENISIQSLEKSKKFQTGLLPKKEDIAKWVKQKVETLLDGQESFFSIDKPPLIASHIIEKASGETIWLLAVHFGVCDTHSLHVILKETLQLYRGDELKPVSHQYSDYLCTQQLLSHTYDTTKIESYWINKLKNKQPATLTPDKPSGKTKSYQGAQIQIDLPTTINEKLTKIADKRNTSLKAVLLTLFQCLIHQYTELETINIGTSVTQRVKNKTQGIINLKQLTGQLENTVIITTDFNNEPNKKNAPILFQDVLEETSLMLAEVSSEFAIDYSQIHKLINRDSQLQSGKLFNYFFQFHENGYLNIEDSTLGLLSQKSNAIKLEIEPASFNISRFDISLHLYTRANALAGFIEYDTDLFFESTIELLSNRFCEMAVTLANNPKASLNAFKKPLPDEMKFIKALNQTDRAYPNLQHEMAHSAFEHLTTKYPSRRAIVFEKQTLTYRELNQHANELATYLMPYTQDHLPGVIGICIERSLPLIISTLGTLKANHAVLPLSTDPREMPKNIEKVLEAQATLIITHINQLNSCLELERAHSKPLLVYDDQFHLFKLNKNLTLSEITIKTNTVQHEHPPLPTNPKEQIALIPYTSGKQPKGIRVPHYGWVNWIYALREFFKENNLNIKANVYLGSPFTFDACFWETWPLTLCQGGTLFISKEKDRIDGLKLASLCEEHDIHIITVTPSILRKLDPAAFPSLRCVFAIGEALPNHIIQTWADTGVKIFNGYGPTEVTAGSNLWKCDPRTRVAIGSPIANMKAYIFDKHQNPSPIGAWGELYLSGAGIAKGYINRPEKTKHAFVQLPDPYTNPSKKRTMYRTGDKVRFCFIQNNTLSMQIEGRIEDSRQVKIHGVRIELDEIEDCLSKHPDIKASVVKAWGEGLDRYLAAYLITRDNKLNPQNIRNFLSARGLIGVKIPSRFLFVLRFPTTKNGKLDYSALPQPSLEKIKALPKWVTRATPSAKYLYKLWCKILSIPQIAYKNANFRSLGGDSLHLFELMSSVNNEMLIESPRKIGMNDFPAEITINSLSKVLLSINPALDSSIETPDKLRAQGNGIEYLSPQSERSNASIQNCNFMFFNAFNIEKPLSQTPETQSQETLSGTNTLSQGNAN